MPAGNQLPGARVSVKLRYFLLLIFFALALTPVLLFRAWPHSSVLDSELDEVHDRHLLLAQNIAAALERYHRDVSTTFSLLSANLDAWQHAPEMSGLLGNLGFRNVCIADPGTGQVIAALEAAQQPCPDIVPEQVLTRLAARAGRALSARRAGNLQIPFRFGDIKLFVCRKADAEPS